MTITHPPDNVVDEVGDALRPKVDEAIGDAVDARLAPSAIPPADGMIDDTIAAGHGQLRGRQRRQSGARRDRLAALENLLAAVAFGVRLPLPDNYPVGFVAPWELVVIAVVFAPETDVLSHPIGTMLDLPDGHPSRWFIAGVLVLLIAIGGHWSGKLLAIARRGDASTDVRFARALGWALGAAVFGLAGLAIYARYQASLKAQADGQGVVDVTEIAFFAGFQLLLALASIGLGWIHAWRVDRAEQRVRRRYVADLDAEAVDLRRQIGDEPAEFDDQHARLDELGREYLRAYREGIAARHPDLESQVAWRERNARDLDSGPDAGRGAPDPEPQADPGSQSDPDPGPEADSGPEPQADPGPEPQADPGPEPQTGPGPEPATGAAEPNPVAADPEPAPATDTDLDDDLFAQIINPPAP